MILPVSSYDVGRLNRAAEHEWSRVMKRTARIFSALMVNLLAASCSQPAPADQAGTNSSAAGNPKTAEYANLAAAAEPFEALTEQAFSADKAKLVTLLANVENAAKSIGPVLQAPVSKDLDARIADAKTAIATDKRADIALSAVEGYRLIVSQFPEASSVPPAVSLLDYAGFRIQADLQTVPVRWDDATAALTFAQDQWAGVSGRITDKKLADSFSSTLSQLDDAITNKKLEAAKKAAVAELDQVDELEKFFGEGRATSFEK